MSGGISAVPAWLLLDVGNSALKWAVVEAVENAAAPADSPRFQPLAQGWLLNAPLDTLPQRLQQAWRALPQRLGAGFACRVAGVDVAAAAQDAAQALWGLSLQWFSAQSEFAHAGLQLRNAYRVPAQLGADRWHALIAARATYPDQALVVINSGTATTVDCLRADGLFAGGVIAPGLRLMFDSLARNTAQLPQLNDDAALLAHPDHTEAAIAGGVLGAQLGLIERKVARFRAESGALRVLLAGGQGPRLAALLAADGVLAALGVPLQLEDNLVLRGVYLRALAQASSTSY